MIGQVAMGIRTDMEIEKKSLAVLDQAVGVLEVGLSLANRLDLSAAEGDAGLEFLQEEVVVTGHPVMRGIPLAAGHGVARGGSLLRAGRGRLDDHMAGLTGHPKHSSNLHRSTAGLFRIDGEFELIPLRLC